MAFLVQGNVQGGDITVACKPLGMLRDFLEIQQVQHPLHAVAAPDTENTVDGWILEGLHDIPGPIRIGARQISPGHLRGGIEIGLNAPGAELRVHLMNDLFPLVLITPDGAGGCDNGYMGAREQRSGCNIHSQTS